MKEVSYTRCNLSLCIHRVHLEQNNSYTYMRIPMIYVGNAAPEDLYRRLPETCNRYIVSLAINTIVDK